MFPAAILAADHSVAAALRHPVCAGRQGRLHGTGSPSPSPSLRRLPKHSCSRRSKNQVVRCIQEARSASDGIDVTKIFKA